MSSKLRCSVLIVSFEFRAELHEFRAELHEFRAEFQVFLVIFKFLLSKSRFSYVMNLYPPPKSLKTFKKRGMKLTFEDQRWF